MNGFYNYLELHCILEYEQYVFYQMYMQDVHDSIWLFNSNDINYDPHWCYNDYDYNQIYGKYFISILNS